MAVIKKVSYWSFAKYLFFQGLITGFITGIIITIYMLTNNKIPTNIQLPLGIISFIIPIITALGTAIIQFVTSFPATFLMNIALRLSKGIEIDIKIEENSYPEDKQN